MTDMFGTDEARQFDPLLDLKTDFEKTTYFQQILVNQATGDGPSDDAHYQALRRYLLAIPEAKRLMPPWIVSRRDLPQFWHFIRDKFGHYRERREFIWAEMQPLLDYFETDRSMPHEEQVSMQIASLSSQYVVDVWRKALARKETDPDGAITAARTLLEAVLKHILDESGQPYTPTADLHDLYRAVAELLQLTSEQHEERLFRKVLGGCSAIVSGLGELRNLVGDAHGRGKIRYRPSPRHAELATNMAGTMCMFIVQTYLWRKQTPKDADARHA